jgi:hypothetical protein
MEPQFSLYFSPIRKHEHHPSNFLNDAFDYYSVIDTKNI